MQHKSSKNIRMFFFWAVSCLSPVYMLAQSPADGQQVGVTQQRTTGTVKGTVVDDLGDPVIGASILIQETKTGVVTDFDGNFTLEISSFPATLTFSYVGMKPQTIVVQKATDKLNVQLLSDTQLEEVVVEAGIIQRNKNGFTGSYTQFNKEELKTLSSQNVLQSLGALDPSFNIVDNNLIGSNPNEMANITMRGGSTMTISNQLNDVQAGSTANLPLFILDGFETNLQTVNDLDINRIESITLLKDAGSTAIYGSKGGNGVVVIETIKPKAGKVMIDYNNDFKIAAADLSAYNLMNAREKLEFEVLSGRYGDLNDWRSTTMNTIAQYLKRKEMVDRGIDTYWIKQPIRTAVSQNHSLNVQGGSEDGFLYQAGVNLRNTQGVMKGSDRQSFGGNVRLTYRVNNLNISNNTTINVTNAFRGGYDLTGFSAFAKANPYYRMVNADGTIPADLDVAFDVITGAEKVGNDVVIAANPYYNATLASQDRQKTTAIANNTSFDWRILENLRWQGALSLQANNNDGFRFLDPRDSQFKGLDYTKQGRYTGSKANNWSYDANTSLSYAMTLDGGHNLSLTGRTSLKSVQNKSDSYIVEGFPKGVEGIPSFSYSYKENSHPNYRETVNRMVSFMTAFNYNYQYRYLFDFNYSTDGSTSFGSKKKFKDFFSFGGGWNISREKFAEDWMWLQELKLRATYGTNGNQAENNNVSMNVYSYFPGNDIFGSASYLSQFANVMLAWQVVKKTAAGLDLTLLNNRLSLTFDVYLTKTNPLVVDIDLKPSSGLSNYPVNLGHLDTKGLEFTATYYFIRNLKEQQTFNIRLTGATYKSTYGGFADALNNLNNAYQKGDSPSLNPNSLIKYRDGCSPDDLWAVRSLGIDPGTGRELFLDRYGNPTFKYNADDRVNIVNSAPKLSGVFSISYRYHQFSANAALSYALGGYAFNRQLYEKVENITAANIVYNQDRRALYDRWREPGDVAKYKNINIADRNASGASESTPISSRFIQRNSYLKGQSVKFAWTFNNKDKWMQALALQDFTFNVSMANFFDLTTIKMERGIEYPFERSVSFGLSARF